ncbi:hypothetical protein ACPOL_4602 [Acidisarcina polymorpha]|uniref:Uncharacterized protein n=1 Tax=Acidisarcina polymorpha TaxID=2211140 RepID=A0A2Z5G4W4_9BACT|nr:hypothetical protein ACPOL_4602 [Acidisarcina polymorpha]
MTGMTVGGFYKHFESKDDLLETDVFLRAAGERRRPRK